MELGIGGRNKRSGLLKMYTDDRLTTVRVEHWE